MKQILLFLALAGLAIAAPVQSVRTYLVAVSDDLMDTPKEREKICKAFDVEDGGWIEMTNAVDSVWLIGLTDLQIKHRYNKDEFEAKLTGIPAHWRTQIVVYVDMSAQDFAQATGRHEKPKAQP